MLYFIALLTCISFITHDVGHFSVFSGHLSYLPFAHLSFKVLKKVHGNSWICMLSFHRVLTNLIYMLEWLETFGVFFCIYLFVCLFIYLFMAVSGLRCCTWTFSSWGEQGLLLVAVRGLLIAVASCCGARALGVRASVVVAHGISSCGSRALECRLRNCGARA